MRRRLSQMHRRPSRLALLVFAICLLLIVGSGARSGCVALADLDSVPRDFCYRARLTVTNGGITDWTDQPVRFTLDAANLIATERMDERAWDLVATTSGNAEVHLMAQDLSSSSAAWWINVESLTAGSSVTYLIYTGNTEAKRDQGIMFAGSDLVTGASHADFDLTDDFSWAVELQLTDASPQNATLLERFDSVGSDGYRLLLVDSTGLKVRAQVDGVTLDVAWDTAWTGERVVFTAAFDAGDLTIYADGAQIGTTATGLPTVTVATGQQLRMGSGLDNATIHGGMIWEAFSSAPAPVVYWQFDPRNGAESSATDPTYSGTFSDYSGNGHTATYTFSRDQSDASFALSPFSLTSVPLTAELVEELAEIYGPPLPGIDLGSVGAAGNDFVPFAGTIEDAAEGSDRLSEEFIWVASLFMAGFLAMAFVGLITKQPWWGGVAGVLPVAGGTVAEVISPWYAGVWAAIVIVSVLGVQGMGGGRSQ